MILSRINNSNLTEINNKLDNNDLEIILSSEEKKIKYKVKGNIKSRIYLQYGNKKDMRTIYEYLKKEILSFNREWAHVFYIFTNEREFLRYYNKLLKIEKKNNNIEKIQKRKDRIRKQIESVNEKLNKANKESISDLKNIFQMEEFKLLYEYISYKRDLYLLNNSGWKFINIETCRNYLKEDAVFIYIENYLYSLFKNVEPLKNKYSIHKDGYVENLYFNSLKKELLIINKIVEEELWKD